MTRNNLKELLDVLEKIRSESYPHISKDVIEKIVLAQYENQDDRTGARDQTTVEIITYLNESI